MSPSIRTTSLARSRLWRRCIARVGFIPWSAAGIGWIRADLAWSHAEREPGKYDFAAWDRLVQYKDGASVLVSYAYDGLGRRIRETAGGTTTDLYYSAAWQVLEPASAASSCGATLTKQSDGSILASGKNASPDAYTVTASTALTAAAICIVSVGLRKTSMNSLPRRYHEFTIVR